MIYSISKRFRKVLGMWQHHKQTGLIPFTKQYPVLNTLEEWRIYWHEHDQPWRTEPVIDIVRQSYLTTQLLIMPDVEQGIYPFRDIKLCRADVEWLLATLEGGRGPVDWNDVNQQDRKGLDLRGANLQGENLSGLPMARMLGAIGVSWITSAEQYEIAAVHMEKVDLTNADLRGAWLREAHLEGANLNKTHLEKADLSKIHLEGANLREASLDGANLSSSVHLEDAVLQSAHMEGVWLREGHLEGADLTQANMEQAHLYRAHLETAWLNEAHLEKADLREALLTRANLDSVHLEGANLSDAHLEGANLSDAHLEGANLSRAHLAGAVLHNVFFDYVTRLGDITLDNKQFGCVSLADAHWGDVNVAVVNWSAITLLGDERTALQQVGHDGKTKDRETRLEEYRRAVRANRQLAVVLRDQGLNEEAVRFAYRAQVLQKKVFWLQMVEHKVKLRQQARMFFSWLFWWFLDLLAGYGYRPMRSLIAYLLLILGFAIAFYSLGNLKSYEALIVSLTAFHGRGFFAQDYHPGDPQSIIAAIEAVVGLIIEISFIATFTQRFFGK